MALLWLVPVAGAIYASIRPYDETQRLGIFSLAKTLTLDNYRNAWTQGGMARAFGNTMFIVIPALFLILAFSSTMAFAVSRFSWRFNVTMLLIFTAGNLLPPQVIFQPLFQMFKAMPWPDFLSDTNTGNLLARKIAVIIIHVAFQTRFCTFVLSNYMKTIPKELSEAAHGRRRQRLAAVLPDHHAAVPPGARGTGDAGVHLALQRLLLGRRAASTRATERPITSSIANLGGQFFSDDNLIAAASMIIAVPTLAAYLALQRQFISGLTLGANKGLMLQFSDISDHGRIRPSPGSDDCPCMCRSLGAIGVSLDGQWSFALFNHPDAVPESAITGDLPSSRMRRSPPSPSRATGRCRTPATIRTTPTSRCRSPARRRRCRTA